MTESADEFADSVRHYLQAGNYGFGSGAWGWGTAYQLRRGLRHADSFFFFFFSPQRAAPAAPYSL